MKISALFSICLLAISCVQATKETVVTGGNMSSAAPGIWFGDKGAFQKTINISLDFDSEENQGIENTLSAWESSVNYNFFSIGSRVSDISDNVSNTRSLQDNVFGVYKMNNWPDEFGTSALAVTQIFGRGYNAGTEDAYNVIYHADVILNNKHKFRTRNGTDGYDLETVMLHEFGHFLGLNHAPFGDKLVSVMYGYISDDDQNRVPLSKDITNLRETYSISTSGPGNQPASHRFYPRNNDPGEDIHIIMQLNPNGDCIHRLNGVVTHSHSVKLK